MAVREFVKRDIPQVVSLYWGYLGPHRGEPPVDLQAAFSELYFDSPWVDPENPSFVYEDKSGDVLGFLGFSTRRMVFRGEPVRIRCGGNFVVHPSARSGVATARIIEAMFAGSQDMLFSDSANDLSRKVLERVGFQLLYPLSIHWSRPLHPATYVVHALSRALGEGSGATIGLLGKPLARLADSIIGSKWNPLPTLDAGIRVEELGAGDLLGCIRETSKGQELQPEYDEISLQWLLRFMERNRKRGELRKILFRDQAGAVLGWSVYYVKAGGVGEVVQIGSAAGRLSDVLTALLHDALDREASALHGVADYQSLADFSDAGCFFTCRGGWALAHSKRSDLIDSFMRGRATLSRLDGEWCLNPGE